jgi:hypothetical protein
MQNFIRATYRLFYMATPIVYSHCQTILYLLPQVVLWDPSRTTTELATLAQSEKWTLSWLGATGDNTGTTLPGATGWKEGPAMNTLYVDVDTR